MKKICRMLLAVLLPFAPSANAESGSEDVIGGIVLAIEKTQHLNHGSLFGGAFCEKHAEIIDTPASEELIELYDQTHDVLWEAYGPAARAELGIQSYDEFKDRAWESFERGFLKGEWAASLNITNLEDYLSHITRQEPHYGNVIINRCTALAMGY